MQDPSIVRFSFFIVIFCLCAIWEWRSPRKPLTQSKGFRWLNNAGLIVLNSVTLSLFMPVLAFQVAIVAHDHGWGFFNLLEQNAIAIPLWLEIIFSIILLDMIIYFQHMIFHRVGFLWRLHRVHHADQDIDVTTGARFHPIEIVLSMWIKMICVMALGISPLAVVAFEIILNGSAMFNHSNAKLPLKVDAFLRRLIVTPDMHRVHHSVVVKETHSNFGFFLSIWDRSFGTYISQPQLGHDKVIIGLPIFNTPDEQRLDNMLTQPFRNN